MKFSLNTKYFINILEHQLENLWKADKEFYPIYKIWSFFFCSIHLLHPVDIEVNDYETKTECFFFPSFFLNVNHKYNFMEKRR